MSRGTNKLNGMNESIHRRVRTTAAALVLGAALAAGGCVVSIGNGTDSTKLNRVTTGEMDDLVIEHQGIAIGNAKDDTLGRYDPDLVTLMSSARYEGRNIEEWRVYAYDSRRKLRFQRWLYFVDGTLVQFGDERVEYEKWDHVRERWVGEFTG